MVTSMTILVEGVVVGVIVNAIVFAIAVALMTRARGAGDHRSR